MSGASTRVSLCPVPSARSPSKGPWCAAKASFDKLSGALGASFQPVPFALSVSQGPRHAVDACFDKLGTIGKTSSARARGERREGSLERFAAPAAIVACALLAAATGAARADEWPSKPIHFIVPFSAGGANDLMGRAAAEGVAKVLRQQVVVDNRPGAGTMLGTAAAARAPADGYTFLVSSAGVISNGLIRESVPYKQSDLVPVAMIALAPSVIVAPPNAPYKNLKDFVAASKAGGKTLHFSTAGTGSTPHFVEGLLVTKYGAKLDVVPYKSGAESIAAVLGGQVDATSEASIVVLPYLKSGKLVALADAWSARISAYPQLSTAVEQGFGEIRIAHWAGVHAPAATPPAILDKLAAAVDAAMKSPEVAEKLKAVGIEPVGGTRASFGKFIDEERARLGGVVKATGMKAD